MERSPEPEKKTAIAKPEGAKEVWTEPLKTVPISDEEAKAEEIGESATKLTSQNFSRKLATGTFLYDFNRIEHMAAVAYRLPIPPPPQNNVPATSAFQKVAIFSVRQNQS